MREFIALAMCLVLAGLRLPAAVTDGLVGHWSFNTPSTDGLAITREQLHPLGPSQACLRLDPSRGAVVIPVAAHSPLAVERGTICFWLNVGERATGTVFEYDNRAVQMNVYRSHFQPRFRGTGNFSFGNTMLGPDWPKFELRESAFYPHEQAVTGEGEWHHFAVSYDDRARVIRGWRDGVPIATVDLSSAGMTPLRRDGLKQIVLGREFSGFLDELRIYDRPLNDAEVARIHAAERATYAGRNDAVTVNRQLRVYSYREEDRVPYRAWLQNRPLASTLDPAGLLRRIAASERDPTIANAARELRHALGEMAGPVETVVENHAAPRIILGTPETSPWIAARAEHLGLAAIQHDGYVLRTITDLDGPVVVVAARVPAGVIFGIFALLRQLQFGVAPAKLDVVSSPTVPLRLVNHWDIWRGFPHDDWRGEEADDADADGNRTNSIYSWDELRRGDTRRVRDWARLLASAGWNAVCPTEINWEFRNNFLEHLDEVKLLAGIFREYGIRLYWSPNYLLALRRETAEALYAAVPDFGGYLLKLGSEAQEGDPRPAMVNRIADCLKPHGGQALVRAFVYGKYRYSSDDIRNLNPHDVIAPEDGHYRDNVVVISKGSPLDWDFSAPIPALDGAIQHNAYGSELVIAKSWPLSWIEKWKWWLEQDNYRRGPGTLNKHDVRCILGVAMIHPAPGWTSCPLNMVNYYGMGRLAQNPELTVDEIYAEWIRLTFGDDPDVLATVRTILRLSDDATRKLYIYRGYRGIWIDRRDKTDLVQNKTPHTISPAGVGTATPELRERVLAQYAPGLRAIFGDAVRGEEFFASFNFLPLDHRLEIGRTVIQDLFANLDEAVQLAAELPRLWRQLAGKIDARQYELTLETLESFARTAETERDTTSRGLEAVTKRRHSSTVAELAAANRAATRLYSVVDFGARGDGRGDQAPAINAAIEACHAAGGGTVFVPSGVFATSSIQLRSGLTLALDVGAVLQPAAPATTSAIIGTDLEGVTVLGPGTLENVHLALTGCRRILARNLNVADARGTALLVRRCTEVAIDNVAIRSEGDGVDLDGSRGVTITDCHVSTFRYVNGRRVAGGRPIKAGAVVGDAVLHLPGILVRDCMLVE